MKNMKKSCNIIPLTLPKSLTNHELERLKGEATKEVHDILELSLLKNDPF